MDHQPPSRIEEGLARWVGYGVHAKTNRHSARTRRGTGDFDGELCTNRTAIIIFHLACSQQK